MIRLHNIGLANDAPNLNGHHEFESYKSTVLAFGQDKSSGVAVKLQSTFVALGQDKSSGVAVNYKQRSWHFGQYKTFDMTSHLQKS
ncbi:MAG TPA: hypothetical protein VGC17_07310 [Lactovum miscens]|uniref:hypothetical protein n=1 Tax=Lactovum miscens TaxID=190387 RepID=UPI002EDB091D